MPHPRVPTALKVLQGTVEWSRTNPQEPKPPVAAPPMPLGMSKSAKRAWASLCDMLTRLGVLSTLDQVALQELCECVSTIHHCRDALKVRGGYTYECSTSGGATMRRAHPEVAILQESTRQLRQWLNEFGATPASRSRVKADPVVEDAIETAYFNS